MAPHDDQAQGLNVRPAQQTSDSPRVKPQPRKKEVPLDFIYFPSDDGTDENLLILLHGLGDTHKPFAKLGKSLRLPQTATLALKAPEQIPYLYEDAWQWFPTFDDLGEFLPNPNPSTGVDAVTKTIQHLVDQCSWPPNRIHLFGFAQGGTVAAETALRWWLTCGQDQTKALKSVVSISGPLISYPTVRVQCPTALLIFDRTAPSENALPSDAFVSFKKGFETVRELKVVGGDGMPSSRDEWEGVMRFWSDRLERRLQGASGLYEVLSGA